MHSKPVGIPISQVVRVSDLVSYADGPMVSHGILTKENGTVTILAFDEGQHLNEHTAPSGVLVQGLDGEAEITISGKVLHLHAGDVVFMPAQQPHALRALTRFKMMLITIS